MAKESGAIPRIGFVGLGYMGARMARRLIDAGYSLTVYNRTKGRTAELIQVGAMVADTPIALAAASDVIITMLSTDAVVKKLVQGRDGVLAGARPGAVLIDMSTVYPETSQEVHEAALSKGVSMVDAPVAGSTPQAEQGTLLIFVGGELETFDLVKPILEVMGKEAYYMGSSGMGTTMKLVVNTLLGVGLQAIAEAVSFGQKAGLDKERLLDVLGQTAVVAPAHKPKLENARREQYPVAFALRLMYKDFGLVLRRAAELEVPMPATAVAQQMCAAEKAIGLEEDFGATIRLMESLAGLPVTSTGDPRP